NRGPTLTVGAARPVSRPARGPNTGPEHGARTRGPNTGPEHGARTRGPNTGRGSNPLAGVCAGALCAGLLLGRSMMAAAANPSRTWGWSGEGGQPRCLRRSQLGSRVLIAKDVVEHVRLVVELAQMLELEAQH